MSLSTESESSREAGRRKEDTLVKLRDELKNKRLVIVVGAGVTLSATADEYGKPLERITWKGLIKNGLDYLVDLRYVDRSDPRTKNAYESLEDNAADTDRILDAANIMKSQAIKHNQFPTWLESVFHSLYASVRDASILDALRALHRNGAILLTTNYDDLLEKHCGLQRIGPSNKDEISRFKRGESHGVLHVHGSYLDPNQVVLDATDYYRAIHSPEVQNILKTFLEWKTILFIGCGSGLEDPNFDALLKWAGEQHENVPNRHCLLIRDGDNLDFKPLKRLEYGPNYQHLAPFLEKLLEYPPQPPSILRHSSSDLSPALSMLTMSSPATVFEQFRAGQTSFSSSVLSGSWTSNAIMDSDDMEQESASLILPLLVSINELYEDIPRALHNCIKYIPKGFKALKDLRAQRASFRTEYRFLLMHLLDRTTAEEILDGGLHHRHSVAALGAQFSQKLPFSVKDFTNKLKSMRWKLEAVQQDIIGLSAMISKRRRSLEKRLVSQDMNLLMRLSFRRNQDKLGLRRDLKSQVKRYLRQSTFDHRVTHLSLLTTAFSSMCSEILPLDEPQTVPEAMAITYPKPQGDIEEFEITQKASRALYQDLCRGCTMHAEHLAHLSLKTDQVFAEETTKVRFDLAFKCDVHTGNPIWVTIESIVNEKARAGAVEEIDPAEYAVVEVSESRRRKKFQLQTIKDGKSSKVSKKYKLLPRKPTIKSSPTLPSHESDFSLSPPISRKGPQDLSLNRSFGKQLDKCLGQLRQQTNKCIGFLEESFERSASFKHLVFFSPETKIPKSPQSKSLAELIDLSQQSIDARLLTLERLHLARVVASAVLKFNSTPWLEGPWRSEDVVFFELDGTNVLSAPHLTVRVVQQQQHPERTNAAPTPTTPYGRKRNPLLFSLGVILLELEYGETFRAMHERQGNSSPSEFHTARRLSRETRVYVLGPKYARIVQQCIEGDFGTSAVGDVGLNDPELRELFYRDVVRVLAELEEGFRGWKFGS